MSVRSVGEVHIFGCPVTAKYITESRRDLGESIFPALKLGDCANPEEGLRRKGFEFDEGDGTLVEIIGHVVFCPELPARELGYCEYRQLARVTLLEAKLSADEDAITEVADAMVLPRHVALRAHKTELGRINLYAPLDYLHGLYVRYHGSGTMPAVC